MTGLYEVLGVPFGFLLDLIYKSIGVGSYALSIVLLTLVARLLMVPSSINQQKGMAKTQRIQAKIRKIQTKYAGNQQKIQEETTALYQREGYNPMGAGCAPMIFQFVLLFGLIGAIYYPLSNFLRIPEAETAILAAALKSVQGIDASKISEFQQELYIMGYIEQIKELAAAGTVSLEGVKESTIAAISDVDFEMFGLSLGEIPGNHKTPHISWLVPVFSFLSSMATGLYTQMKQKQTNPAMAKNPTMGCMTFGMPLMSLFFVINYPIGIGVYWIASSVFGFISTVVIGYFYSPKKTMAKLMIEETVERRSKEANLKLVAAKKNENK